MNELVDATNHDRLSLQGENLLFEKFINTGVTSSARRAVAAIMAGSSFRAIFDYSLSYIYWAMVDSDNPIRNGLVLWLSCTALAFDNIIGLKRRRSSSRRNTGGASISELLEFRQSPATWKRSRNQNAEAQCLRVSWIDSLRA